MQRHGVVTGRLVVVAGVEVDVPVHLAALATAPSDSLRQRHREQGQVQRSVERSVAREESARRGSVPRVSALSVSTGTALLAGLLALTSWVMVRSWSWSIFLKLSPGLPPAAAAAADLPSDLPLFAAGMVVVPVVVVVVVVVVVEAVVSVAARYSRQPPGRPHLSRSKGLEANAIVDLDIPIWEGTQTGKSSFLAYTCLMY